MKSIRNKVWYEVLDKVDDQVQDQVWIHGYIPDRHKDLVSTK